jgi:hypothetical protein
MNALTRLLSPLNYLRIHHERKTKYDLWIPLALAFVSTIFVGVLPVPVALIRGNGLMLQISELITILTGFFIAALAAVATFNREGMDELMAGTPPTLRTIYKGQPIVRQLTRRQFLCYLFGYLAFVSLVLYFVILVIRSIEPTITELKLGQQPAIRFAALFAFLFVFWNMIITTLVGLFYLTDRIHSD